MAKSKILIVSQHYWPETFRVNDIADYLVGRGYKLDVLCGIPNYPKGSFFEGYSTLHKRRQVHDSVNIRRAFELPRGSNTSIRIFLNYISFPLASLFHVPRLLTRKYDKILIYQTSPVMMAIAGIMVGKFKKTETTMYVLDLWPENLFSVMNIKNFLLRKIATSVSHWHYRHVDKLVVLSEKMKSRILDITNVAEDKIIILPQACEKLYEKDIKDAELAKRFSGKFNIVFTGNISPAQSFETIIAAAKRLKDDGITDINWIIVGDGMSRQWLEDQVRDKGLSDSFYFEGMKPMADIPRYTTIADVLVGCLVKSELLEATIPAKVMSYLAAGRPMALAMDGEAQDLVNKLAKSGLAGPTGDGEALAENIKRLHAMSPEQRRAMGKRGRDYHLKHFERNIILGKLDNFIFG